MGNEKPSLRSKQRGILLWHSSLLETCIEHIFLSVVLVETRQQVGVDSFGLGILVGVFGTISTIAAVLHRWLQFRFFLSLKKGLV